MQPTDSKRTAHPLKENRRAWAAKLGRHRSKEDMGE